MMLRVIPSVFFVAFLMSALGARAQVCEAPQVLIMADNSSSMNDLLADGSSKWQAATVAISGLATDVASLADLGLMLFPTAVSACDPGTVVVPVGPNPASAITGALGAPPPMAGHWTPMAESLGAAAADPAMMDSTRNNSIILITDGWQFCDPYLDATRFNPVSAVGALTDAGITVYLVGFGSGVDSLMLNRAAVRASTALPGCDPTLSDPVSTGHCYYQADDLAGLRAALTAIGRSITDETCDGVDNDCDGLIDEGFDVDGDGFTTCGSDPAHPGVWNPLITDCNDSNEFIRPGAVDICDGLDNDCDGAIDPACACTDGTTQTCGRDEGACAAGTQSCVDGRWTDCQGFTGPTEEICDGIDQDCDGLVDDGAPCAGAELCIGGQCIDPNVPTGDADGGVGPIDEGIAPPQKGGCGCRVAGEQELPAAGALVGLAIIGLLARRRRR